MIDQSIRPLKCEVPGPILGVEVEHQDLALRLKMFLRVQLQLPEEEK